MFQRRSGKQELAMMQTKLLAEAGQRVHVATLDQSRTVAELQRVMPGCFCEIVGDMFVVPHPRVADKRVK